MKQCIKETKQRRGESDFGMQIEQRRAERRRRRETGKNIIFYVLFLPFPLHEAFSSRGFPASLARTRRAPYLE